MRKLLQVCGALVLVGAAYLYVGLVVNIVNEALWPWV